MNSLPSVMKHDFSRIPTTDRPRSTFDRSHGLKTAFDSGYLVPIEIQEVLPGDDVEFDASFLGRLAPTVTPVMDNVYFETHWFYCPSRLLWTNFTKMMGERVNPNDSIDYLVPVINSGDDGFAVGSLADYLGIPTGVANLNVSSLPFRMYAKVWDDWYRDENLQDSIIQSSDDLGDSSSVDFNVLRKRGKRHDYFTSALPWTQKGTAIQLPLGTTADVVSTKSPIQFSTPSLASGGETLKWSTGTEWGRTSWETDPFVHTDFDKLPLLNGESVTFGSNTGLRVDLAGATAATINSLRMAFQLQRLLETDARSGTRFCEIIRAHFNTVCPDARLQRSEYLGGSSDRIQFTPVAQTSATGDDVTAQGNLVANGKVGSNCRFRKAFTEHGYIIGLANVRCDLNYQQGLNKMWSRRGRYDYFWPTLQNLGEQAVLNREIFAQGDSVTDDAGNIVDDAVFGYQERYAEYRYNPSVITGKLRSTAANSLDVWHLAQHFESLPLLSGDFIEDNPPLKRVLAVQDEPEIILDCFIGQKWTRAMGTYSIPGLIDHL